MYPDGLLDLARRGAVPSQLGEPRLRGRAANVVCGDESQVDARTADDQILEVAHTTRGCVFATASAAILADVVPGRRFHDVHAIAAALRTALMEGGEPPVGLEMLAAARVFPTRRRCALLPWDALLAAIGR